MSPNFGMPPDVPRRMPTERDFQAAIDRADRRLYWAGFSAGVAVMLAVGIIVLTVFRLVRFIPC